MIPSLNVAMRTIHTILTDREWTVSVAESLTAGLISSILASQSGASAYFRGGITAYTIDTKVHLLDVDLQDAQRVNCVSSAIALSMAQGAGYTFDTDFAIATTGYAEPWRANVDAPLQPPLAYYAIASWQHGVTCEGVVQPQGMVWTRKQMRDEVTLDAICEFANVLEAL